MFGLIKKIFIGLLTGLVNGSNHTKCVWSSNQKCMIQPTLINLHPNEYSQEFHYYPFSVKLDKWTGSCNTIIKYYYSLIKYVFQVKQKRFQHDYMNKWIENINKAYIMQM